MAESTDSVDAETDVKSAGELAIWSTIDPQIEPDYLHWLTREHLYERVNVPGFRSGRVLRRQLSAPSEYLMLYELDHADVVQSAAYLERLNAPSSWTQRIMPQLKGFRRGGGTVQCRAGGTDGLAAYGARIAVARFDDATPAGLQGDAGANVTRALVELDAIVTARVMCVANVATSIGTREKSMRTGAEGSFSALLIIEALHDGALDAASAWLDHHQGVPQNALERFDTVFATLKPHPTRV